MRQVCRSRPDINKGGRGETHKDKQVMFGTIHRCYLDPNRARRNPGVETVLAPDGSTGNKVFASKISHSYIMSHSCVLAPNYTQITPC